MDEKGFIHPERGYWQTLAAPTAGEFASYPQGTIEVPLRPSARHEWDDTQWVEGPPPIPSIDEIKAECRRRIYAQASAEAQMNMATAAAIASGVPEGERSPEQAALLAGVTAALEWVSAMRANVIVTASAPPPDITADDAWPPVPPEAAAVAAMF